MKKRLTLTLVIAIAALISARAQKGPDYERSVPTSSLTTVPLTGNSYLTSVGDKRKVFVPTIIPTGLTLAVETSNGSGQAIDGIFVYMSVLRYKGKPIDICPITRGILGSLDFDNIYHRFPKSVVSTEDALDLLSNYSWEIKEGLISKDFVTGLESSSLPPYLTRAIEAVKFR